MKAIFERLESSGQLPTPPGVVVRLLQLTRRPEVSVREIADTIGMDPGLSAKILRFVNSPMAGVAREITSLQQAVAFVGVRGVKMMALSFSVLSARTHRPCSRFDPELFALQSLACAVAAKQFTQATRLDSINDAFMAGLLSQIGRSVFAATLPKEYAAVLARSHNAPIDLPEIEQAAFGADYTDVGGWLLRQWTIPESLCAAIATFRKSEEHRERSPLARVLVVSELLASVICPSDDSHRTTMDDLAAAAQREFKLEPEHCLTLVQDTATEVEQLRQILELPKNNLRSLDCLETEVRERLAELSLAMHLENQTMALQQEDLLRRATTDPLTGIGNRAAFDARMTLELERCARGGSPFALLMIDVDRFKKFNDSHGHQAGDRVLQMVARTLDNNIRKVDYLARYGGEEFSIVAPGTGEEGVAHLAERLRYSVENTTVTWDGKPLNVTISIGAAVFNEIADADDASMVIRAADAQLYAAKCAGRNRVCIASHATETLG
jgi:diguanylate cyclase (GGDEF)-like protein